MGVLVVRFGCQGNLTRPPFGGISLTARQVGHSKCETPASSTLASDTRMTSVKEHPMALRIGETVVSPTGSRAIARLPTPGGVGLGDTCGMGKDAETDEALSSAWSAVGEPGMLPGVGAVFPFVVFVGFFNSA